MTMNKINIMISVAICAMILTVSGCKKDNFSVTDPGANIDPVGIQATMTIRALKNLYYGPNVSTVPVLIDSDIVISGIINGDDRSGNLYKVISLQDSTGGLQVKIDGSSLYYTYPQGRRILIKLKGLYFFSYGGTIEIGAYIDHSSSYLSVGPIPLGSAPNYIIKGKWGLTVTPIVTTATQLEQSDWLHTQSMLYEIDNVQYRYTDTGTIYADPVGKLSVNKLLDDCSGNATMVVRTSGYAAFASAKPAKGNGKILGLFTYYSYASSGNYQFTIRDTTDVQFTNDRRCQ